MSVKAVRDARAAKKKTRSLKTKTFHLTLLSCVLLGAVLLVVGLGIYGYSLSMQYASQAFSLSKSISANAEQTADSVGLAQEVMRRYRALNEEDRAKTGTPEYRAFFADLEESEAYNDLLNMLQSYAESDNVSDVYLAMYDEEHCAMVYLVDPDVEDRLHPGEWEPVNREGMEKFLHWNGEGMLYEIEHMEKYGWICTAGSPIRNAAGEACEFVLVDVTIDNVLEGMRTYTLMITVAMVLVIAAICWLLVLRMNRMLVKPINQIAGAAQDYVKDRRAGEKKENHFSALGIRSGDEIENLSLVMADMERDLAEYEENLTRVTAEKERIGAELSMATKIQSAMLPSSFPAFPNRNDFDIFASMDPAKEVGGDFYDFSLVDEDHLYLAIGDVSGKGVPAALFMIAAKTILKSCAMLGQSPAEILTKSNEALCSNNPEDMFVTVWVGVLELSTGKLKAANAGHEYPALKRANGGFELYRDKHDFLLGAVDGMRYREYELTLEPGAKLFVYTDGVAEAMASEERLFGLDRTLAALNEQPQAAPEQLLKTVRRAVDDFVQNEEQFDDLTMLCLEYRGR